MAIVARVRMHGLFALLTQADEPLLVAAVRQAPCYRLDRLR